MLSKPNLTQVVLDDACTVTRDEELDASCHHSQLDITYVQMRSLLQLGIQAKNQHKARRTAHHDDQLCARVIIFTTDHPGEEPKQGKDEQPTMVRA